MGTTAALRVLVVDDHATMRICVSKLVDACRPLMETVGSAGNSAQAMERAAQLLPDVVVLDADLAGEDGLALIEPLKRRCGCRIVLLSAATDPRVAQRALRLGAEVALAKGRPARELWAAIAAAAGVPPGALDDPLRKNLGGETSPGAGEQLTKG